MQAEAHEATASRRSFSSPATGRERAPEQLIARRDALHAAKLRMGHAERRFPIALATMWTYLTESKAEARATVHGLSEMLKRDPATLVDQVLVGPADECVAKLARYADAGVDTVFIWPVADHVPQLRRFGTQVVPHPSNRHSSDGAR